MKKTKNEKRKTENGLVTLFRFHSNISTALLLPFTFLLLTCFLRVEAQEQPPAPSAPKAVSVPAVKEKKLPNGLTVAVAERKNVPLVTVQLLIKSGAFAEDSSKAGLADMTADLLTKGTKTRTATEIAEQLEFLGGSINTGADWNKTIVTVSVMSDKLDQAMAIMADVILTPTFKQSEINLLKSQKLDGLKYNLKQPGFLTNFVASRYSFGEHPAGGTIDTINAVSRKDFVEFHKENYFPKNAVLIFAGDITEMRSVALTRKFFGNWKNSLIKQPEVYTATVPDESPEKSAKEESEQKLLKSQILRRILVVDLPNSGQSSVSYSKRSEKKGRVRGYSEGKYNVTANDYFPALTLNSILGGGYSSRLNQEIRIKRGLSYGAGSSFAWRSGKNNFATRTQTKDASAAEVAELVLAEVKKLGESSATAGELVSRKSVLTGNFGRNLETNEGLATAIADLYSFDLAAGELNAYTKSVQSVSDAQVRDFASRNLRGGDIIIVGDYAKFKDDLAKRFPGMQIEVVKAEELDLSKDTLRK